MIKTLHMYPLQKLLARKEVFDIKTGMEKMPVIQVFALGGTIAMTPDASSGVTPSLGADALVSAVPGLSDVAEIKAETLTNIASANITIELIRELCEKAENSDADGVVVTQGTDTMEESAFVASLLYSGDKPLVFTGAMRAALQPGADGPNNLYNAVVLASSKQAPRVSLLMNSEIHDPWHVVKEHTFALDAFVSEYKGPVGYILEQQVQMRSAPVDAPRVELKNGPASKIAVISALLGESTDLIKVLPELGYKGLVVEALGAGHVSEDWADALEALAGKMPVLLSTRVSDGPVLENSYGYKGAEIDLINRGLIPCGALKARKARLLLSLVLASDPENWREKLTSYIKSI